MSEACGIFVRVSSGQMGRFDTRAWMWGFSVWGRGKQDERGWGWGCDQLRTARAVCRLCSRTISRARGCWSKMLRAACCRLLSKTEWLWWGVGGEKQVSKPPPSAAQQPPP